MTLRRLSSYFVLFAAALMSLASCTVRKAQWNALLDVESYIEERPDSALSILEAMSAEKIHGRKSKAKFSLLYSMALDKNYIDTTDLSIIAPAVEYYRHHGSATDKMLVNYYYGSILQNSGDYEEALRQYVIAEQYANKSSYRIAVGRLYKAMAKVYEYCCDTDGEICSAKKAAECYIEAGDTLKYHNAVFTMINGYVLQKDTASTKECLQLLEKDWLSLDIEQKSRYYTYLFELNRISDNSYSDYKRIIEEYLASIDMEAVQWLAVAEAYYRCGEYEKAHEAIDNYLIYDGEKDASYHIISGYVHDSLGDKNAAADEYRGYIDATNAKLGYLVESDTRFIEERYKSALKDSRQNFILIILILGIIILILSGVMLYNKILNIKKEKESYKKLYSSAEDEMAQLKDAFEKNYLSTEVKMRISERLELLNDFIKNEIKKNYSDEAMTRLEELMRDKHSFIESTRMSFMITHPAFIADLKNRGLDDNEIGYCCLYALGLKGKDLSGYIGSRHYRFSRGLRAKLGLGEHDTNLDIFLKEILSKSSK